MNMGCLSQRAPALEYALHISCTLLRSRTSFRSVASCTKATSVSESPAAKACLCAASALGSCAPGGWWKMTRLMKHRLPWLKVMTESGGASPHGSRE